MTWVQIPAAPLSVSAVNKIDDKEDNPVRCRGNGSYKDPTGCFDEAAGKFGRSGVPIREDCGDYRELYARSGE